MEGEDHFVGKRSAVGLVLKSLMQVSPMVFSTSMRRVLVSTVLVSMPKAGWVTMAAAMASLVNILCCWCVFDGSQLILRGDIFSAAMINNAITYDVIN
mmetsp:Transcript_17512/g.34948  ORF Transcript_17512/g.34948 Transcript_17512/m.34948 type:complete len:98 (-) Transcript_17512:35-328(-)